MRGRPYEKNSQHEKFGQINIMPARKPQGLKTRHDTKAEKAGRIAAEEAMRPGHELPERAPARLKGHPVAAATWRRIIRTYNEIEAEIVTRLDQDLLIDYCILIEQLGELDLMRKTTFRQWLELGARHDKVLQESKDHMATGELDLAEEKKVEAILLAVKCVDALEAVKQLDARADGKRKLLRNLKQDLYMTPRARAATAPNKKEKEVPPDDMDQLLGDVRDYVNGSGDGK